MLAWAVGAYHSAVSPNEGWNQPTEDRRAPSVLSIIAIVSITAVSTYPPPRANVMSTPFVYSPTSPSLTIARSSFVSGSADRPVGVLDRDRTGLKAPDNAHSDRIPMNAAIARIMVGGGSL